MIDKAEIPFGPIGYIVYKRTYARRLNSETIDSKTEEFEQTIDRVLKACNKQLKCEFSDEENEELREIFLSLKGSVAGRFLWQLGTKTVNKLGLPSLQNCAACVVDSPVRPFTWAMELLMLGCGVGYNIQKEYVYQLPKVLKKKITIERFDNSAADFIVPDTREGWVKLLGKVLKAHFYTGKSFTYSAQLLRSKGAVIAGFGGTASGPDVLCKGMQEINDILNNRIGERLRPIDCLDIMNIIGSVVVAGNVRRSAQVALGDYDDLEFLKAKRWDLGAIPNWRAMSNNSVVCNDVNLLPNDFWDTYVVGEPYGLMNMNLARQVGRTRDFQYQDVDVVCGNPCMEQMLANFETCCLAEIYLPNISSKEEFLKVTKYLYRICKHSLALKCDIKETEEIVHKNMRMGIGLTGLLECPEKWDWLAYTYEKLREFDKEYSLKHIFPESIKLTTIKPSGTLSLLPGVTPGAHPSPAGPYYIRRMRISADSPLISTCIKNGYFVEPARNFDGTNDTSTMVVEFPCKVSDTTPVAGQLKAVEHLELVKRLQREWSDNSVSCTIYYTKEELPEIQEYLKENFKDNFKTLSFLLYHGHGFDQAPYETITKNKYEELIKKVIPITTVEIDEEDFQLQDCENGVCPIK